jgi:tetratricopeptide (TPR) repeat protein
VCAENYGSAIVDATEAINLEPSYIKGYYRRGTANLALGKLKQAKSDFREAVKIEPGNKDARVKLAECEKAIKKEKFEQALHAESLSAPGQDPDLVDVEATYAGPHTDDGEITLEFVEGLMAWQKDEKKLHKKYALQILQQVREILKAEKSVVDVTVPDGKHVTVCGDVHGQYYDLVNIFDLNGRPSEANPYLFNGDFVDRGSFSIEVILLLFAYKCLYPKHLHLNRGNHETVNMNKMYGFEGEVASKYSAEMMALFTDIFQWLPLAHVIGALARCHAAPRWMPVLSPCLGAKRPRACHCALAKRACTGADAGRAAGGKVLVVHGGLFSKSETSLDDLRSIGAPLHLPPSPRPVHAWRQRALRSGRAARRPPRRPTRCLLACVPQAAAAAAGGGGLPPVRFSLLCVLGIFSTPLNPPDSGPGPPT